MSNIHKITGKVVSKSTKQGIGGLRVEGWDEDLLFDDFIGQATTNEKGEFTITYDTGKFSELFFDRSPDLYFKIFKGKKFLCDTKDSVIWNEDEKTTVLINVDPDDVPGINYVPYKVFGNVQYMSGSPAQAELKLFEVKVTGEKELATTKSDEEGNYSFSFRAPESTDIRVKAFIDSELFAESDTQFNIGKETEVDLTGNDAVKGPSEFELLGEVFDPLLEGVDANELDTEGILFLAEKTGTDVAQVLMLAKSHQLASETIPSQFYYTLFRSGAGMLRNEVYRVNANTAIESYQKVQGDLVPSNGVNLDAIKKAYIKESTAHILATGSKLSVSNMNSMLSLSLSDQGDREKFVELYYHGEPGQSIEQTWASVEEQFGAEKTKALRLDGMLGYLTFNNVPLIQKLKQESQSIGDPSDLVAAGFYNVEKLATIIDDSIDIPQNFKGDTDEEKKVNYMNWIAGQLQFSYPSEVVADLVNTDVISIQNPNEVKSALLYNDNGFKIGNYSINKHIQEVQEAGVDLSANAQEELKSLHRSYALTPNVDSINFLMTNNLDSAFKVTGMSEVQFTAMYMKSNPGGDQQQAALIYNKAQQDAGLITHMATAYGSQWATPAPWIIGGVTGLGDDNNPDESAAGVKEYPTLDKLFGSLDYCSCGHCQSLLSPTAYLVDLLQFIDVDEELIEGTNPLTELFDRRPDIQHSELTCENTYTVLPYIDLVNEILEYYVVNEDLDGFEGYNMDEDITTEELLANPQFVNETAYQKLNGELSASAAYPMKLPFNRNLELLREFFSHFEIPLHETMERLREDEELESNSTDYSWREILTEQLGLSPKEYELFTDHSAYTIQARYGLEDADDLNDKLANAKEICRILDIKYKELVGLLETEFINPAARLITKLEILQSAFNIAKEDNSSVNSTYGSTSLYEILAGVADEDATIVGDLSDIFPSDEIDESKFGGSLQEWIENSYEEIMSLIFLSPTGDGNVCDFGDLELKYANPDQSDLEEIEYWKFIHFVRLWKKMGWTIVQTDRYLTSLYDSSAYDISGGDLSNLDDGFKDFLVKLALNERVRVALGLSAKKEYQESLALWTNINTYGKDALYKKLFLNASVLEVNDVYTDDGYGNYLSDSSKKILDYASSLQAAFALTSDEWTLVIDDLGFDSSTVLTLENVSSVNRIGFLAKQLKLSVEEFLTFKELSGVNPFAAINYQSADDYRTIDMIQFIEMVSTIDASDFSAQDLNYLFKHEDETGNSQPSTADSLSFARTLYLGLKEIIDGYPIGEDLTDEQAQALITSIYGEEYGGVIYSILGGTVVFSTSYDHSSDALESAITDESDNIGYDDLAKNLTYSGVMTADVRDALQGVGGVSAEFIAAVQSLYDDSQAEYSDFFTQHPEFESLHSSGSSFEDIVEDQLVPLVEELKEIYLKQTLAEELDLDVEFMEVLLQGELEAADHYILHSSADDTEAIIKDYLAVGNNGLSAAYYNGATISGTPESEATITQLAFDGEETVLPSNTSDPELNISASWKFYLEAPTNENYNLYLDTDATGVQLWIDGEEITMNQSGTLWDNASAISFNAGTWYEIEIQATDLHDTATFKWQRSEQLIETVPEGQSFPYNSTQDFLSSYIKLLKTVRVIEGLGLTQGDAELVADTTEIKFSTKSFFETLPTVEGLDTATIEGFIERLLLLLEYAGMKSAFNITDGTLAEIMEDPLVTDENDELKLLLATNWEEEILVALIQRYTGNASSDTEVLYPLLKDWSLFQMVMSGYDIVNEIGSTPSDLFTWTTVDPTFEDCTNMQSAVRAKYDYSSWLEVIQPINDRMRKQQRDALVSYILFALSKDEVTNHIDTSDKLYEFFLIDVDMSPCMKTSRTKQAISSTQLFIQRVLLNLEANVDPSSITSEYWSWMKNYRVWEANRKVFIYPENWLDPSLRDTKSPFFKDFESELLQSDINDDRASVAVMNYLEKLDKVANMTICGMCREDENKIHVLGKTSGGKNAEYYHRNYSGSGWSAWEKINLDIEGGPVIPVFWRNRLFIFWTTVIQSGDLEEQLPSGKDGNPVSELNGPAKFNLEVNICWSEFYNGKWQTKRTSDFDEPVVYKGLESFYPSQLSLFYSLGSDGELAIYPNVSGETTAGLFVLFNKHSDPLSSDFSDVGAEHFPYSVFGHLFADTRRVLNNGFGLIYNRYMDFNPPTHTNILGNYFYKTNQFDHPAHDTHSDPLFIKDFRHLFFVEMEKKTTSVPFWVDFGLEIWGGTMVYEPLLEYEIPEPEFDIPELIEVLEFDVPDPIGPIIHEVRDLKGPITNDPGRHTNY